jgi:hypothetical protein
MPMQFDNDNPPTPTEVMAYMNDNKPEAVEIVSADCPACGELGSMAIRIVDGVEVSRKCYSDECYL